MTLPRLFALAAGALVFGSGGAHAQPAPVYKDAERFAEPGYVGSGYGSPPFVGPRRPVTRSMGVPPYAGSEYGLGKPRFNGIGTRPDWGRSNP